MTATLEHRTPTPNPSHAPLPNTRVVTLRAGGPGATGGPAEFQRQLLLALQRDVPRIVIDLSEVPSFDSSFLSLMITALREARARGGDLVLCRLQAETRMMLEFLKLERVLRAFEHEGDARNELELQ